ncbi:hypothetical protein SS1G_04466 [Sclerotinia sclerotiorum 1980 UF-70]|uniref:Mitochondrial genome maintenance protein MGM101 n=1 Tax=Sclerotinia sclerotiorum (strain ATCC 18683 / 1980 / Ss-1) TaxID=665079 RepID=A7EGM4_SCLS1|nr:hypothetical protein SS1G_04466 [Sclerotinia sclerotiorum 1980 UF-70]EDO01990.1 hypothetical protein SS1G_04466 [Sclerotinia sclerotiorum 1980 UF-70]
MATITRGASRSLVADAMSSVSRLSAISRNTTLSRQSRHFSNALRNAATPTSSYTQRASVTTKPPTSSAVPVAKEKEQEAAIDDQSPIKDMTEGLADEPLILDEGVRQVDWTRSYHGLSSQPFSKEAADILLAPIPPDDVEVKPDGIIYLPEIKYRRILNRAFGPGGLVSVARGEQDYFAPEGIPTATEGCKSNALMRCCKDLGVASELWDPRYIRKFMKQYAKQVWGEHVVTKKKKQLWVRKDDEIRYPYKESKFGA